jgi:hypothetical protein
MNFKSIGIYGLCPISVLPHLKHNELRAYIALSSFQGNHDSAFPGLDLVAKRAGILKSEASKAISSLVKAGYVTRVRRYGKSNIYQVKLPIMDESSYPENPGDGHMENPGDGHMENPDDIYYHYKTTNLKPKEYPPKTDDNNNINTLPLVETLNINNIEGNGGSEGNAPQHTPQIPEKRSRIDLETSQESVGYPNIGKSSKAPQNGSPLKIAKSVVDSFYEFYKGLNEEFGMPMTWDAKETKILREKILGAGIPLDQIPVFDRKKSNPHLEIILPALRLKKGRVENPASTFFKKKFLPSTFTVKYTDCLPTVIISDDYEEDNSEELAELNKKLGTVS